MEDIADHAWALAQVLPHELRAGEGGREGGREGGKEGERER